MSFYIGSQKVCPVVRVGVNNEDISVTENGTYTAGEGYTGLGTVSVSVTPAIESLSVTPTTSQQIITAPSGTDGYSPITVSAVTSAIDNNITEANIKSGVTILGVTGSVIELAGETRSVSINSTSGNTFTPSSGKNGITSITVMPTNQALTVTATTSQQTKTVPSNYSGFGTVTVNAVTSAIDSNIKATNIKSGVTILGVTGSVVELAGETRLVSITSTSGNTFTPSSGKNGITSITVTPTNQTLTITPTTSQQTKTVPSNYSGYGTVTCNAVTSAIDSNIKATNIKSGVSILGVNGSVTELVGETRSVSITSASGNTFTPSSGKNGITSITVTPTNQARTVTPTTSSQSLTVNSGYSGNGTITVNAVTSSIDSNITAGNIKKDVTILGVTGTFEGGITPTGTKTITSNGSYDVTNYATAEVNVEGAVQGANRVVVVDYDGTILKEEYLDQGAQFTLPSAPTNDLMTFEQWLSPVTITSNKITVPDYDVYIGPNYTTKSGKNEFDIQIDGNTGLTFTLNMNGTKDWGDGSSDTATSHTYAEYGYYTVKCDGTTFTSSSSNTAFGASSLAHNKSVLAIRLNTVTTSAPANCFAYCENLETFACKSTYKPSGTYLFYNDTSLKCSVINISSLPNYTFQNDYALKFAVTGALTSLGTSAFSCCGSLEGINTALAPTLATAALIGTFIKRFRSANLTNAQVLAGTLISTLNVSSTSVNYGAAAGMPNLETVNFLSNVTSCNRGFTSGFGYMASATATSMTGYTTHKPRTFNFMNNTSVPTCNTINWTTFDFGSSVETLTLNVPYALHDEWIHSTNWSAHPECIKTDFATITFSNVTKDINVYVNGYPRILSAAKTMQYGGTTTPAYLLYNPTTYTVSSGTISSVTAGSTKTVTDACTGGKKITLSTLVTGCSVSAEVASVPITFVEESTGKYVINITGSGQQIDYDIIAPAAYNNATGSITTTGSAITKNITLSSATYNTTWTRPNLTAKEPLGGDSFAVAASSETSTSYPAWYAVRATSGTSYQWRSASITTCTYTLYNPNQIKASTITINFTGTSYMPTTLTVDGSDDNSTWTSISSNYSASSTKGTLTMTPTTGYKYYRLNFTRSAAGNIRVYVINVTAVQKDTNTIS